MTPQLNRMWRKPDPKAQVVDHYPSAQGQGQDPVSHRDRRVQKDCERFLVNPGGLSGRGGQSSSILLFFQSSRRRQQPGLGFLVLAGAADTVNPTPAHEGK